MNRKSRILALALCLVLLCSMFAACNQTTPASSTASPAPASSGATASSAAPAPVEIVDISMLVWDRGTIPADQGSLEENWWTEYTNEQVAPLGARVNYVMIPRAQEAELLSTMLAANNAPDLSKTNEQPLLKTYITGGGVHDITDYIDQHGANIKALLGDAHLAENSIEGRIYAIPHLQNGITNRTTWMRTDWLDAIGMEIPNTPDEFHEVLKAIKAQDPGKVGNALIPFGMISQKFSLLQNIVLPGFVAETPTPEKMLVPYQMWPELKDALRYLNTLYNEGLLTDEFILDKDESMFRQKIARGEMFAFIAAGHYPYHSAYGLLYDKVREVTPDATLANVDTFKLSPTADRVEYYERNPVYQYKWFVPSSSKNPEVAVKVLDWMSSKDGYEAGCLGIEGEDYNLVNGLPEVIDQDSYLARVPWIEPQYGTMGKPYPTPSDKETFLLNYIKDFNPDYHDQIKAEANYLADLKYYVPTVGLPTPISDKATPILTNYWDNEVAKIVTAKPADFDAIFDATINEYKALGGDAVAEELVAKYKEQNGG